MAYAAFLSKHSVQRAPRVLRRRSVAASKRLRSVTRPKQARSEETLVRLLDAAEKLLVERGLSAVSVTDIAAAAGSSVGGFYARFKDKDELLRALHEREQRHFQQAIAAAVDPERWAEQPLKLMIERAMQVFFARVSGRLKLTAAFLESAARRPEQWAHAVTIRREVVDSIAELLARRAEEVAHPDPPFAIRFAIYQLLAFVNQRALYTRLDAPSVSDLSDERVREELTRSLCRYLGLEAP